MRSPQESLWSLLAAHALIDEARAGAILVDDAPVGRPVLRLDAAAVAAAPVRVTNAGTEPTLVVVTAFGVPTSRSRRRATATGSRGSTSRSTARRSTRRAIALNDRLVAVVTVTPERDIEARLIVSDPLPAGLEIDNPNLLRSGETGQLGWLDADDVATHTEFRADRFVAAVDWQGDAAVPARLHGARGVAGRRSTIRRPRVEDMYRPAYRARTDAGRVEVRRGAVTERRPRWGWIVGLVARADAGRLAGARPLDRGDGAAGSGAGDVARRCSTATGGC